jgi:hypothetical protein
MSSTETNTNALAVISIFYLQWRNFPKHIV